MNLNDMFGLDGRIALVTGGSRGIGKMIVEGYLAAGAARVYISARKSAQIEEAVADFETRYPGKVIGLPVDLSTVEGCRALAKELEAREDRLDILVNNAGAAWGEPFEGFPESGWDKVMDINVKSPFFLTQALHGLLKAGGTADRPAKVINIGSIDGKADDLARIARFEIGDGFLDLRALARRDVDARGARGEIALDDHLADPARAAGDERDAAVEAEHVLEVHGLGSLSINRDSPYFSFTLFAAAGSACRKIGTVPIY